MTNMLDRQYATAGAPHAMHLQKLIDAQRNNLTKLLAGSKPNKKPPSVKGQQTKSF